MAIFARRARTADGRGPQPRRAALALAIASVAGLSLLASACSGSSGASPGSSNASKQDPMAYAACMRSHGVPNFPDPPDDHTIQKPSDTDLQSPIFQAAYRACRHLNPSGGSPPPAGQQAQLVRQMVAFARCMRSHGVPEFPDPTDDGSFQFTAGQIDRNSPIVTRAVAACQSTLRGSGHMIAEHLIQSLVQGAAGQGSKSR
jgi:hypothetical protein